MFVRNGLIRYPRTSCFLLEIIAVCVLFGINCQMVAGAVNDEKVDVPTLKRAIEQSEHALKNLRVEAQVTKMNWDADSKAWVDFGGGRCTAWYEGVPDGKAKVKVEKELIPWRSGATAFTQNSYTVAFNGRCGMELDTEIGTPRAPRSELQGTVTAASPVQLSQANEFMTGRCYSLYGIRSDVGGRLSALVDDTPRPPQGGKQCKPSTFTKVSLGDTQCVQIVAYAYDGEAELFDLDPARGYAVMLHEHIMGDGTIGTRLTVNSLMEAAPGVFYPKDAIDEDMLNPNGKLGDPHRRGHFIASKAVANAPSFSEDDFSIKWPPHTFIDDKITGRQYTISEADADLEQTLDNQVKEATNAATTAPSAESGSK